MDLAAINLVVTLAGLAVAFWAGDILVRQRPRLARQTVVQHPPRCLAEVDERKSLSRRSRRRAA